MEQEYITDEFGIMRRNPNYTGGVFNPQDPYARNAMQPYWQSVDQASGNPQNFSQTMAAIESQGGQNLTSGTGAVGPFQFTGIAAQQVGIPKAQTVDPYIGTQAAAELASQNRQRFVQAYGREPNGFELYMMHQQGANGAMASLGAVDGTTINQMSPTVRNNILAQGIQGINGQSLVSDFVDIFDKKYSQYEPFTGQTLQPQNSQMGGGYQPNLYGYGDDGFDTGFNGGGMYTGGLGNTQSFNKGGSTGPQYVTDQYGVTRAVQGQQSYGNNEYGYGGGYDPNAYGYGGTDYSTGNPQNVTNAIQNAQYMSFTDPGTGRSFTAGDGSGFNGVKNGVPVDMYGNPMPGYSGQPDITVYANDPWATSTGGLTTSIFGGDGSDVTNMASSANYANATFAQANAQSAADNAALGQSINNTNQQIYNTSGYYNPQYNLLNNNNVNTSLANLNPMYNPGPIYL